ncbi:MAG: flagellar hook capping FlgD N-terminal domain-containing protein [Planctomycetota bacterium]|jgi:flagellar basal-body rod modification protein FlgD|nr:flagellar hook capping FlgD N-terminal domain-containing protein [Planctomycetota bacterium]MDP6501965.1 flagellar hook capping FlgD N-terminal domain-containing protein [Planctomycetota bacterium]
MALAGLNPLTTNPLANSDQFGGLGANAEAERTQSVKQDQLDKDSFLQLFVTQLQNQDPTSPMDNMQFSEQLASFASVEQLQNLNSSFDEMQKAQQIAQLQNVVGKEVSYSYIQDGEEVRSEGVVDAVRITDAESLALINGQEINITDIDTIVRAGFSMTEDAEPEGAAPADTEPDEESSEGASTASTLSQTRRSRAGF